MSATERTATELLAALERQELSSEAVIAEFLQAIRTRDGQMAPLPASGWKHGFSGTK